MANIVVCGIHLQVTILIEGISLNMFVAKAYIFRIVGHHKMVHILLVMLEHRGVVWTLSECSLSF